MRDPWGDGNFAVLLSELLEHAVPGVALRLGPDKRGHKKGRHEGGLVQLCMPGFLGGWSYSLNSEMDRMTLTCKLKEWRQPQQSDC